MKLSQLIHTDEAEGIDNLLPGVANASGPAGFATNPDVTSIHYRSSDVRPGGMFFALKGQHTDGHRYIRDAVSRGAAVIVVDAGHQSDDLGKAKAVVVFAKNTRKLMAAAASRFFGNPSEKLYVIGITGTNGKTTTAYLVEHILRENRMDVGVISTINYRYHGKVYDNPLTTPESFELQQILAKMADAGVTHVVMEVSSHGVAMDRIYHCWFDMGIYTNLSQDHLDFHGHMDAYWSCKKRFFTDYLFAGPKKNQAKAVINTDNDKGAELSDALKHFNPVSVGTHGVNDLVNRIGVKNTIRAQNIRFDQHGMNGDICFPGQTVPFSSTLIGRYNIENILCAAGAAWQLGIEPASAVRSIKSFNYVPGRLEPVSNRSGRHVLLDYAHTPGALENVLTTLKEVAPARLICIFGCGGDRDRAKRALMGEIAARFCDFVVITSDNPRTEDPDAIITDICKGVVRAKFPEYSPAKLENGFSKKGYIVEPDRERAIFLGIRISRPDDTILIAGKGHEDYQIIGKTIIAFDDREKAVTALAALSQE